MPVHVWVLSLAAAATQPVPGSHHFSHQFVSPMGEPFRAGAGGDALKAWFGQADANHDGILSGEEMQADAERFFGLLDSNHDGEIDPDEITQYEVNIAPSDRTGLLNLPEPVVAADTNFNRGVSREEFRKAAMLRFQALDVDHQGRLTLSLLESLSPAGPPRAKHVDEPNDTLSGIDPAS
jgi:Ca2+-binding EF-hand superfamily protein